MLLDFNLLAFYSVFSGIKSCLPELLCHLTIVTGMALIILVNAVNSETEE